MPQAEPGRRDGSLASCSRLLPGLETVESVAHMYSAAQPAAGGERHPRTGTRTFVEATVQPGSDQALR